MNLKRSIKLLKNIIAVIILLCAISFSFKELINDYLNKENIVPISYGLESIPIYSGEDYEVINNNEPFFKDDEMNLNSFESYSDLDSLGRCGVAFANVSKDTMPKEKRQSIGMVKPSGWHTIKYNFINGKYLYNRCHLIGYQLTGENANEKNLITCTRQMNIGAMLDFENQVADYISKTNNHVLYRSTPFFENDNLLASGVLLEAKSVEDNGKGICFNVFIFNVQDKVIIDYTNGESKLVESK